MPRLGPDPTSTNIHEFETERLQVDLPRPEGIIRHAHRKGGEWVDQVVYGMLAEEWPGA